MQKLHRTAVAILGHALRVKVQLIENGRPPGLAQFEHPSLLDVIDPSRVTYNNLAGRQLVEPSSILADGNMAVLLVIGQSNAGNAGALEGRFIPEKGVYNYNIMDDRIYVARDPLLGTTQVRSNFVTRLGDLLVRRGNYDRVLLVPIAHGGTFMNEWAQAGRMHGRLLYSIRRIRELGFEITAALWQQGEAESAFGCEPSAYCNDFWSMVAAIRRAGVSAPIYVALSTLTDNRTSEVVRQAQRSLIDPSKSILLGPDTDSLGPQSRFDGCHFSVEGVKQAAELWYAAVTASVRWR